MKSSIFIFPTETSYGLGCDARDTAAVATIFKIKGRAIRKTVPLIAASQKMVEKFVTVQPREVRRVMKKQWPGALTLILRANAYARAQLAPGIIATDGTVAIRVSAHAAARALSKNIGAPIVSTSANKSGEPACYSSNSVRRIFKNSDIIFIDVGRLSQHPATTIAQYKKGVWNILRHGEVKIC